jgi:hypothetical protein
MTVCSRRHLHSPLNCSLKLSRSHIGSQRRFCLWQTSTTDSFTKVRGPQIKRRVHGMLIQYFLVLASRLLPHRLFPALGHQQVQSARCCLCSRTGQYWSAEARHATRVKTTFDVTCLHGSATAMREKWRHDMTIWINCSYLQLCYNRTLSKPTCSLKDRSALSTGWPNKQPHCGNMSRNRSPSLSTLRFANDLHLIQWPSTQGSHTPGGL